MSVSLADASFAEIALRAKLEQDSGMRVALVLDDEATVSLHEAGSKLIEELSSSLSTGIVLIEQPQGARVLERKMGAVAPADAIVVVDFSVFASADWRHLDALRSRFQRAGPLVLLMELKQAVAMLRDAPNFVSWLGGAVFLLRVREDDQLSKTDRMARLAALEKHTGLSSAEVLRQAEAGTLPRGAEFAEWLLLLDRPDLLDR